MYVCVCVCIWVCACKYTCFQKSEALELLELKLWDVVSCLMWGLGTELGSPGRHQCVFSTTEPISSSWSLTRFKEQC